MEERSGIPEAISYLGYPGFSERRGVFVPYLAVLLGLWSWQYVSSRECFQTDASTIKADCQALGYNNKA